MRHKSKDWDILKREAVSRLRSSGELSGSNGAIQPLISRSLTNGHKI